jgi:ankyrin repeat domain-containing protein 50
VIEDAQMCALLVSVEKMVRIAHRGRVYELVYTPDSTMEHALENLRSVLVDLYSASLMLLANSAELFSKNTAARTVYAILHPGEAADGASNLERLEIKLGDEVQACESGRSAAVDARLMTMLHKLDEPLTRVDERVFTLLQSVDKNEHREILEWISPIPYREHHNTVKDARTSDTCEWLIKDEKFRQWNDTSSSVILWLQGSRKHFGFPHSGL